MQYIGDVDAWDRVLRRHVTVGEKEQIFTNLVDYVGVCTDHDFHDFIASLATVNVDVLDRDHTFALYINAYNAFAVKMIADHQCRRNMVGNKVPLRTIKDLGLSIFGPYSSVWFRHAGVLGGKRMSLNTVEQYLRCPKGFGTDARLHACIVCASLSCPNLRVEAFRADKLEDQMEDQMHHWLTNPTKGFLLDHKSKEVKLSKIFLWFKGDFEKMQFREGSVTVLDVVSKYISNDDARFIRNHKKWVKMVYFDYNWNVNGQVSCTKPKGECVSFGKNIVVNESNCMKATQQSNYEYDFDCEYTSNECDCDSNYRSEQKTSNVLESRNTRTVTILGDS